MGYVYPGIENGDRHIASRIEPGGEWPGRELDVSRNVVESGQSHRRIELRVLDQLLVEQRLDLVASAVDEHCVRREQRLRLETSCFRVREQRFDRRSGAGAVVAPCLAFPRRLVREVEQDRKLRSLDGERILRSDAVEDGFDTLREQLTRAAPRVRLCERRLEEGTNSGRHRPSLVRARSRRRSGRRCVGVEGSRRI
jgi:hypothetical protein